MTRSCERLWKVFFISIGQLKYLFHELSLRTKYLPGVPDTSDQIHLLLDSKVIETKASFFTSLNIIFTLMSWKCRNHNLVMKKHSLLDVSPVPGNTCPDSLYFCTLPLEFVWLAHKLLLLSLGCFVDCCCASYHWDSSK